MNKKWKIEKRLKISAKDKLSSGRKDEKAKIEQIIKILLDNRKIKGKKQIEEFLNSPNPYTLDIKCLGIKKSEVDKAIKRIKRAIINKEKIIIYGDYDADGICATAILWETLHSLRAKTMPFIPNREKHGYGLNKKGIDEILKKFTIRTSKAIKTTKAVSLIITVDNGITAKEGVDYAKKKGIDVIITDHHQKKIKDKKTKSNNEYDLPKAHAIIVSDKVCGAGVAWFLAKEIYQHFHKTLKGFKASNSLELACIGTITDLMPVLGINRSLIKYGLIELRKSKRPGIKALCAKVGISQSQIRTYEIGYIIGPRLNAMGRLGDALESLRLLCTKRKLKADGLATKLGMTNLKRQQLTQTTFEHAKANSSAASNSASLTDKPIIIISHSSYNQGVIGLVAGKLVEEFCRPAVVIAEGKDYSKGSVRSIKGFNVIKSLRQFNNIFEDLGGHPMAAGFTIKTNRIKELKNKLELLVKKEIKKELLEPIIKVDLEIGLEEISWQLEKAIEEFSPFGISNSKPTFVARKIKIVNARAVGKKQKHLKLTLQAFNNQSLSSIINFNAIAFNFGYLASKLSFGSLIDICFTIEKNVWHGNENLELTIKDIKLVKN